MNHKILHIVALAIVISLLLVALALTNGYFGMAINHTPDRAGGNESALTASMPGAAKIEYLTWPEYGNRSVLRSKYNNIAFTWGHEGLSQQFFYNNIFTYNLSNPEDYFCTPDDYIIAYGTNHSYRVKAVALNWTTDYRITNSNDTAIINTEYRSGDGFNPFASVENVDDGNITMSNWTTPPLDMTITHVMNYNESFMPMTITVKNNGFESLRVIYVFQDGAWMTSFKYGNQDGIYQNWPDGADEHPRLWNITDENRNRTDNLVGMYDDQDGGMFAGTYAPPQSDGIRFLAAWVPTTIGEWAYIGSNPGVYNMDNILLGVSVPNDSVSYNDAEYKLHGILIDFGEIEPGDEASQSFDKIMFTGYMDHEDMRHKLDAIIQNITYYYGYGSYHRDYQAALADEHEPIPGS
jgi:hypothetical protein